MAVAQNAVVIAYRDNDNAGWDNWKERLLAAQWKVGLFNKQTGALLWSDTIPVEPLRNGLCIDRSGNIVIALRDGRVVCYGTAPVHVAGVEPQMARGAVSGGASDVVTAGWSVSMVQSAGVVAPVVPAGKAGPDAGGARPELRQVSAANTAGARDVRPFWQVASDPLSGDTAVTLGAAAPAAAIDPADYGVARAMAWRSTRPSAAVVGVSSSARGTMHGPRNSCDGDLTTRWSAASGGVQSLTYDLGSAVLVDGVTLVWYALRSARVGMIVSVSADGERYDEVDRGELVGRGTRETYRSFMSQAARFVKITLEPAAGLRACDIYEAGIHTDGEPVAHAVGGAEAR
jgi:hypothetical protein